MRFKKRLLRSMFLNQLLRSGKRKRINLNGEDRKVIRKFAFLPKIVVNLSGLKITTLYLLLSR